MNLYLNKPKNQSNMDHKNNLYRSFGSYFISIFSDELIAILVVYFDIK